MTAIYDQWNTREAINRFPDQPPTGPRRNVKLRNIDPPEITNAQLENYWRQTPVEIPDTIIQRILGEGKYNQVRWRISCVNLPDEQVHQNSRIVLKGIDHPEISYFAVKRCDSGREQRAYILLMAYLRSGQTMPFNHQAWPRIILSISPFSTTMRLHKIAKPILQRASQIHPTQPSHSTKARQERAYHPYQESQTLRQNDAVAIGEPVMTTREYDTETRPQDESVFSYLNMDIYAPSIPRWLPHQLHDGFLFAPRPAYMPQQEGASQAEYAPCPLHIYLQNPGDMSRGNGS